jgi:hypothetical protein
MVLLCNLIFLQRNYGTAFKMKLGTNSKLSREYTTALTEHEVTSYDSVHSAAGIATYDWRSRSGIYAFIFRINAVYSVCGPTFRRNI